MPKPESKNPPMILRPGTTLSAEFAWDGFPRRLHGRGVA
jgi:hypothetical protein